MVESCENNFVEWIGRLCDYQLKARWGTCYHGGGMVTGVLWLVGLVCKVKRYYHIDLEPCSCL